MCFTLLSVEGWRSTPTHTRARETGRSACTALWFAARVARAGRATRHVRGTMHGELEVGGGSASVDSDRGNRVCRRRPGGQRLLALRPPCAFRRPEREGGKNLTNDTAVAVAESRGKSPALAPCARGGPRKSTVYTELAHACMQCGGTGAPTARGAAAHHATPPHRPPGKKEVSAEAGDRASCPRHGACGGEAEEVNGRLPHVLMTDVDVHRAVAVWGASCNEPRTPRAHTAAYGRGTRCITSADF
jgi:hypothetical protein